MAKLSSQRNIIFCGVAASLLAGLFHSVSARADWEIAPESRWHLYTTYAQFVDQQNMLAWRGYNRYWGTVGINGPLFGNNSIPSHPQLVMHLSGNVAMHVNDGGGVFTESLDTRWGFDFQFAAPVLWDLRFSLGIQHESGHTVDGTDDPSLGPLNLGDNTFRLQAFRDFIDQIRVGVLVAPVILSIPENYPALVTVMADYFPFGASEDTHHFRPYVSFASNHRVSFTGHLNYQFQVGVAVGSHFAEHHFHEVRVAAGYYEGADPRAKYAQYDSSRSSFGYFGLILNL